MRIVAGLEYDGSQYHGWQRQNGLSTVQGWVEAAFSKVANHEIKVQCAGRTDTGVHATGQVVHFDSHAQRSERSWIFGANSKLPKDISVNWIKNVDDDFHARFKAEARRYRYVICNSPVRPGLLRSMVSWNYRPLDECRMAEAAKSLEGRHDFTSYRALGCQAKSPVRNMHHIKVVRQGDLIVLELLADGFLHHMVRNIAGVLMAIGAGAREIGWANEVLQAKDRALGGVTAPSYGLYLVEVKYPDRYDLPQTTIGPRLLEAWNELA